MEDEEVEIVEDSLELRMEDEEVEIVEDSFNEIQEQDDNEEEESSRHIEIQQVIGEMRHIFLPKFY
jgi:hypothetical protein